MEEKILNTGRDRRDRTLELARSLLQINSTTGREGPAQQWLADRAEAMDLDVDLREPDVCELFRQYPAAAQYPTTSEHDLVLPYDHRATFEALSASEYADVLTYRDRPNMTAVWKGSGGGRSLLLTGHVDTVPAGAAEEWDHDPFGAEIDGGKIFARGAADMKAGLTAALAAVDILRSAGFAPRGDVVFASAVNEEHCGNGTLGLLAAGVTADAAVVLEPTGGNVLTACPGNTYWQVAVSGCPRSPGARWAGDQLVGVSAIEKLGPIIEALLAFERAGRGSVSMVIGEVHGGTYTTVTADACLLRGCVYFQPGRTANDVMGALSADLSAAADRDEYLARHRPQVTFLHHRRGCEIDPSEPIIAVVSGAVQAATGAAPDVGASPFAADMGLLVNEGHIPTVMFGPGSIEQAHRVDEHIAVQDVLTAADAIALLISRWCG